MGDDQVGFRRTEFTAASGEKRVSERATPRHWLPVRRKHEMKIANDSPNGPADRVDRTLNRLKFQLLAAAMALPILGQAQSSTTAFTENGGLVVMAADHYQTNQPALGYAWVPTNDVPGFVSPAAM